MAKTVNEQALPTVYFDGSCPVCSKEIDTVKKASEGNLCFVDVHAMPEYSEKDKPTLLRDLHIKQGDNRWLVGLDANIYMWQSMKPGTHKPAWLFALLARVLKFPVIHWCAQRSYRLWADRRYKTLYEKH